MSEKSDRNGGPAFPTRVPYDMGAMPVKAAVAFLEGVQGMSLRDWFAGKALQGMTSRGQAYKPYDGVANMCYSLADAMLAERDKERSHAET